MTDEAELVLDANAVAGLLEQLLGSEITAAPRRCGACGDTHEIGRHHLYQSAGIVLRCPSCGELAAQISELPDRVVARMWGTWSLALPAAAPA
jgi:predicted RNA-binding Zn-ribbon protein involved in translation (DUF1610 family)